jgi:hypothetical protein
VQAALISYALFLLALLILAVVVLIVVVVRSLLSFIRKRGNKSGGNPEQRPARVISETPTERD